MVYTVSDKLGSDFFYISDRTILSELKDLSNWHLVAIPSGSYNPQQIVAAINLALSVLPPPLNSVIIEYNEINGKMSFRTTLLGGLFALRFDFDIHERLKRDPFSSCIFLKQVKQILPSNIYKDQLTLGWLLGFRGNYSEKIEAEKIKRDKHGRRRGNNKNRKKKSSR